MSAIKINPETLEHEGTVAMPGAKKTLFFGLFNKHFIKTPTNKTLCIFTVTLLLFAGQHSDGQNIIFTDGEYINQIAACKDVSLPLMCPLFLGASKDKNFKCKIFN